MKSYLGVGFQRKSILMITFRLGSLDPEDHDFPAAYFWQRSSVGNGIYMVKSELWIQIQPRRSFHIKSN